MKRFIVIVLSIIGGLTVFAVVAGVVTGVVAMIYKNRVPDNTVLELALAGRYAEYVPEDSTARMMMGDRPTLLEVIQAIRHAAGDDRIKAMVADIGDPHMGFAEIQEIRNAILEFRKKGKTAIAYTDAFGQFTPGNGPYYLASAFDKIYMQPSGTLCLSGLIWETRFLKNTLKKVGIKPRMDHRWEYKNYLNVFTEEKYTQPHKESVTKVTNSLFAQMVGDIARQRNIPENVIRGIMDKGMMFSKPALDGGLIDGLLYRDGVYKGIEDKYGKDTAFISLTEYIRRNDLNRHNKNTVALIYGVGGIRRGQNGYNPLFGDPVMGSDTVSEAFRSAIKDKTVKAILFRINSPGGSYIASDTIWKEVVRAGKAGKPVVVSMGNVAGSGGYFIAMAAHKIVAQPGTITGSIGVIAGKMLTEEFWKKLGVSWDEVHTSKNADMWTGTHDYSKSQWQLLQDLLDDIYADFVNKAAEGRALPVSQVKEAAKGRIWTGEDAKALGLVDELGGFPEALRLVKQAAKISEDEQIHLKPFPRKKTFFETILDKIPSKSGEKALQDISRDIRQIQPVLQVFKDVTTVPEDQVLAMPDLGGQNNP